MKNFIIMALLALLVVSCTKEDNIELYGTWVDEPNDVAKIEYVFTEASWAIKVYNEQSTTIDVEYTYSIDKLTSTSFRQLENINPNTQEPESIDPITWYYIIEDNTLKLSTKENMPEELTLTLHKL